MHQTRSSFLNARQVLPNNIASTLAYFDTVKQLLHDETLAEMDERLRLALARADGNRRVAQTIVDVDNLLLRVNSRAAERLEIAEKHRLECCEKNLHEIGKRRGRNGGLGCQAKRALTHVPKPPLTDEERAALNAYKLKKAKALRLRRQSGIGW